MSHSVQVTLIADQYITLIGHEVNVHDLTVIHLDDSGVVCGYSTDEHTKLRSPAPAATVTGWRLLEVGEVIAAGDQYLSRHGIWMHVGHMADDNVEVGDIVRRRLTPPAQGDETRAVVEAAIIFVDWMKEIDRQHPGAESSTRFECQQLIDAVDAYRAALRGAGGEGE